MIINLCNALDRKPAKRVIFLSSTSVYGDDFDNLGITEETPLAPNNYYGISKLTGEQLLQLRFREVNDQSLKILRAPLIYGPGDLRSDYGPNGFCKAAIQEETILLWGDGSEKREFIYIDDLIHIICNLAFKDGSVVLNVTSGQSYSYLESVNYIRELTTLNVNSQKRTRKKVDLGFSNYALLCAIPELTFTPLNEGIKKTFNVG